MCGLIKAIVKKVPRHPRITGNHFKITPQQGLHNWLFPDEVMAINQVKQRTSTDSCFRHVHCLIANREWIDINILKSLRLNSEQSYVQKKMVTCLYTGAPICLRALCCWSDDNLTKKKPLGSWLRESCQPSLINVSLSYRILRKSGRLTSKQTSHLDTDFRTKYRTALYLRLHTVVKNKDRGI